MTYKGGVMLVPKRSQVPCGGRGVPVRNVNTRDGGGIWIRRVVFTW